MAFASTTTLEVSPTDALWNADTGANFNALDPTQFKILFSKLPNFAFSVQSIEIPAVTLGSFDQPNPYLKNQMFGEKLQYGNLSMTMIIDSKLKSYIELFKWIKNLSTVGKASEDESEATLLVGLTDVTEVRFVNVWPASLGDVKFYSTPGLIEYAMCDVDFNYDYFYFPGKVDIK